MAIKQYQTKSEKETLELGASLGRKLSSGAVVLLVGELGAGKTVFTKGIAKGIGMKEWQKVHSPTFTLLHIIQGEISLYHFDLYRLDSQEALDTIGFDEFIYDSNAISCVEWAEKADHRLPDSTVWVTLTNIRENVRGIRFTKTYKKANAIS